MKITSLYKVSLIAALAGIITTGIVSCKKYNDWDTDESANRLFRPTSVGAVVDGISVTLRWKAKPGTTSYTIELSKDSLQFTQIIKTYSVTNVTQDADGYKNFIIPDRLDDLTRYSTRIKGLDTAGTKAESQWEVVTFKTTTEQLMSPVTDADKTPYTVTLNWKTPNDVSHFILVNSQGVGTKYDITVAEKTAGSKKIENLTPTKSYTAILYNGTLIRGTQAFALPADLPKGPNVVYVAATDDLATMLLTVKDSTMFVLRQGTKYTTINTNTAVTPIILPNNVSFTIWGEAGANKPILAFNGITLPANAGTIKFENLDITGYENGDPATKTKRNYIFNQSTASTTSEIIFENCTIRNLVNCPMRLQQGAAMTIDKYTMNNCLVYDIGDDGTDGNYAIVHNAAVVGKINNITITNSTFATIGHGLIVHNTTPSVTVNVSNNTFYNVVGNGRYLIDYNGQAISGGFTFANNILSKTYSPAGTAQGIRSTITAPAVTNSYKASDAAFAGNFIKNIIDYTKPGTDLFTDVTTNNFLIKDNTFAGKSDSGDPRWRQ